MATLEKRVEKLESVQTRRQKYTPPDPAELARRGQWLYDTTEQLCAACPERIPRDDGAVFIDLLTCSAGKYAWNCKTFLHRLRDRADCEDDQAEKDELLKYHAWLNGDRAR